MTRFTALFSVTPVATASGAAVRYVPLVILTRVMAAARFLLVAWLLRQGTMTYGEIREDSAKAVYGTYQFALEMINWAVPLLLFGAADVAERYAARFEKEGRLAPFLRGQFLRVISLGAALAAVAIAAAPMVAAWLFGDVKRGSPTAIVLLVAANIVVLALYQWVNAALRGVRAYAAAAGLETIAASSLLALSCAAALGGNAVWLLAAYVVSNALPLAYYGLMLRRFARRHDATIAAVAPLAWPRLDAFALWSLLRLLMMMTFGLVAVASVQWLSTAGGAKENIASFAMPYRIAQMLGFIAVTLWASTYGIATRAWAHGSHRRARVTLMRTGRIGGVILLLAAALAMLGVDLIMLIVPPPYRGPVWDMLPGMLALFVWYGLLAFYAMLGDLEERPQRGAALWLLAVAIQLVVLWAARNQETAPILAMKASCAGLGIVTLVLAPVAMWRPARLSATAVPIGLVALAPLSFFVPWDLVWWVGPVVVGVVVGFLWAAGLLVRPRDKRAIGRLRKRRRQNGGGAGVGGRNNKAQQG